VLEVDWRFPQADMGIKAGLRIAYILVESTWFVCWVSDGFQCALLKLCLGCMSFSSYEPLTRV